MNDLEKPGKCPVCEKTNICSYEGDEYYRGDIIGGYAAVGCRLCGYELRKFGATEAEVIAVWNRLSLSPAAPVGDVFTMDGITYKILTDSTVQVGDGTNNAISTSKTECVIPATVSKGGTSYTVTSIWDYAFDGCSSLTSVMLPASLTSIGDWALHGCSSLASVTLPASLTSIGDWALARCPNLTSVMLPASLTSIGDWAFAGCRGLTSICYLGTTEPTFDNSAFSGGPDVRILHVPNATGEFTASKWGAASVVYGEEVE